VAKPAGTALNLAPGTPPLPPPTPIVVSGPIEALRWGIASALTCRRPLIFVLLANLILAAAVLYPLHGPMDASLSHHPEAERIGRQLDVRWWTDWTTSQAAAVTESVNMLGLASFVMVLAGTFFAGGMLEALRHGPRQPLTFEPLPDPLYRGAVPEWRAAAPGPATVQVFLKESARRFPRFLVFLLLSLPLYGIAQVVLNRYAVIGLDALLEQVEDERVGLLLTIARAAIFVAAFDAVTVLFEYVRAMEILRPGATLHALFRLPAVLLASRPGTMIGIEAGAFVLQIGAMLAFIPVDRLLASRPVAAATLGFAAAQAFLFARMVIRAGAQGAQIRLAQAHLQSGRWGL
jgi:hypothetical protein